MGKSFGQSFGETFSKVLPQVVQSSAQLAAIQQQRELQLGLQYESQKNSLLTQAAEYESKGNYLEASNSRKKAQQYDKLITGLYGGSSDPLSQTSEISAQSTGRGFHPIQAIKSGVKKIFHPAEISGTPNVQKTQQYFKDQGLDINNPTQSTQEPGITEDYSDVADPNNPNIIGGIDTTGYDPATKKKVVDNARVQKKELDSLQLKKKQVPPALHGDVDAIIANPSLTAKEKLNEIGELAKNQNQYIPDPKEREFFDESQNLIEAVDRAKALIQSDKTLTGLNSFGNTSKNYRDLTQQLQRIDSILKNRKLVSDGKGGFVKGATDASIAPKSGWFSVLQGDNDAINKLDLIREQAVGDYNQQKEALQGFGKKIGKYEQIDLSQPIPQQIEQPKLKDFKNPKKVQTMIDQGMIDFKSAGDLINKAIKATGSMLEQPVPLKQAGAPSETIKLPNGAEIIFQGKTGQPKPKQQAQPKVQSPVNAQPQEVAPGGDAVEQELQQYYKDGTLPKGKPGKGNVSSNQAGFINNLAKNAPSLQTIATLANTIQKNQGSGIDKNLISQLDKDGLHLLDLALAYLENGDVAA